MKHSARLQGRNTPRAAATAGGGASSGKPGARPCLISVVVPAYNEEGYIGACLDSLWRQDFQKIYDVGDVFIERGQPLAGEFATEPYEAGWASEALFFVRLPKMAIQKLLPYC